MVIEIDITIREQGQRHSFDLSVQDAPNTRVTPKHLAISLPKLPHVFSITVLGLLQRLYLDALRNDIGVFSSIGTLYANTNVFPMRYAVGITDGINNVCSAASEVIAPAIYIDSSARECAELFAMPKDGGSSVVTDSSVQIMLGKYRTLADMDNDPLSAFDDMELSDVDFIII